MGNKKALRGFTRKGFCLLRFIFYRLKTKPFLVRIHMPQHASMQQHHIIIIAWKVIFVFTTLFYLSLLNLELRFT
jgi:hypothetical protein